MVELKCTVVANPPVADVDVEWSAVGDRDNRTMKTIPAGSVVGIFRSLGLSVNKTLLYIVLRSY